MRQLAGLKVQMGLQGVCRDHTAYTGTFIELCEL